MVEENLNHIFSKKSYSNPARKKADTDRNVIKHIDNNWTLESQDLMDYGFKNNKGFR